MLDRFVDPELMQQLPFGQKALASLYTTLLGMATTFIALAIVWVFVALLSKAFKPKPVRALAAVPAPTPVAPKLKIQEDEELVAVITAALSVCRQVPAGAIRVRNIVRTQDFTPSWGRIGRMEQLRS